MHNHTHVWAVSCLVKQASCELPRQASDRASSDNAPSGCASRTEERAMRIEGGARRGRVRRGEGGFELRGALAALVLGNSRWRSALHARAHLSRSLAHSRTHSRIKPQAAFRACVQAHSLARTAKLNSCAPNGCALDALAPACRHLDRARSQVELLPLPSYAPSSVDRPCSKVLRASRS